MATGIPFDGHTSHLLQDCDGWMFRASYHGCALYSKVRSVTECPDFDCEAGIINGKRSRCCLGPLHFSRLEESLHYLTDFVDAPTERYRGHQSPCLDCRLSVECRSGHNMWTERAVRGDHGRCRCMLRRPASLLSCHNKSRISGIRSQYVTTTGRQ